MGLDFNESDILKDILNFKIVNRKKLEEKYHDHALVGNYAGFRECHILPDWLLIYAVNNSELILTASRTGTHSDLFDK